MDHDANVIQFVMRIHLPKPLVISTILTVYCSFKYIKYEHKKNRVCRFKTDR